MAPLVVAVLLSSCSSTRLEFFPSSAARTTWRPGATRATTSGLLLPGPRLGLGLGAVWSRLLRADMALTLQSDFIMPARAQGISPCRVLSVRALRLSILTLITSDGAPAGGPHRWRRLVEHFFGPKGVGDRLLVRHPENDLLAIQAIAAVLVAVVVLVNLFVDLLYSVVDPRIRHAKSLG